MCPSEAMCQGCVVSVGSQARGLRSQSKPARLGIFLTRHTKGFFQFLFGFFTLAPTVESRCAQCLPEDFFNVHIKVFTVDYSHCERQVLLAAMRSRLTRQRDTCGLPWLRAQVRQGGGDCISAPRCKHRRLFVSLLRWPASFQEVSAGSNQADLDGDSSCGAPSRPDHLGPTVPKLTSIWGKTHAIDTRGDVDWREERFGEKKVSDARNR